MSLDVTLYLDKPCAQCGRADSAVFIANITHNLADMAKEAGIYRHVWRPEEVPVIYAKDMIEILREGISQMKRDPECFKKHNSWNGWGMYDNFLPWLESYLSACIEYPDSYVQASR